MPITSEGTGVYTPFTRIADETGTVINPAKDIARDSVTNVAMSIDYAHHEIHSGSMFVATYHEDKSIGTNVDILISVADTTKWPHVFLEVEHESETDIALFESTTASNNGAVIKVINHNRNSTSNNTMNVYNSPTMSNVGTQVYVWHSGSGKGSGAIVRDDDELILKQGTKYLLRSTATAAGWIAVKINWYEHTNK